MTDQVATRIEVRNLQRTIRLNAKSLQLFAERALVECGALRGHPGLSLSEVAVLIVSDRRIAALHERFMGIAGPTDVITFQHGEIFISAPTARRQAKLYRNSLAGELQLYIVHGLLHLRGWDDRTPAEARRMKALQEKVLRKLARRSGPGHRRLN